MSVQHKRLRLVSSDGLVGVILTLPWLELLAGAWKLTRLLWRGLTDEGMYEVLEYESVLELKDRKGKIAKFSKRQKVRYLQNNIIAYQDQAWGDGKILIDYRCKPGIVVDQYRPGHKTYLLISLREIKNRGDIDEFNIQWGIRDGFVRSAELWDTEIRHKTRSLKIQVIFPESRQPLKAWIIEHITRKKHILGPDEKLQLPDHRWQVTWQTNKPRLNERYQLQWTW